jgi:hypothetical protein
MTIAENTQAEKLPVPVREHPHWRVTFRPSSYDDNRIPSLSECLEVISKHRVRLRGWDFPLIPHSNDEMACGSTWVAGWSMGHIEYWRLYQSTQFVHLAAIREITDPEWAGKLRRTQHFDDSRDISDAPGFLSITNLVYRVTEIFEFAARLSQAGIYTDPVEIAIRLSDIKGVILASDPDRGWPYVYSASEPQLEFRERFTPAGLVAGASDLAINCVVWFVKRFGWINPNISALSMEQKKLLTRQL